MPLYTEYKDRPDMSKSMEASENRGFKSGKWTAESPRYFVNIFTVSKREFHTTHALVPVVDIPACATDERYKKAMFIPSPFPQCVDDVFRTGDSPFKYHEAERIAQDIVNPSNPSLNQDFETNDPYFRIQDGTDFSRHGIFWTRNEVPTEEELKKAEARRDKFLEHVLQQADKLYTENPTKLESSLTANGLSMTDVRAACDLFGEERPFCRKYEKPQKLVPCTNCGTPIKQGLAYHRDEDGDICILDWKRTVEAGKRKREDVPSELRWWTDEPKAKAKAASAKFDEEI